MRRINYLYLLLFFILGCTKNPIGLVNDRVEILYEGNKITNPDNSNDYSFVQNFVVENFNANKTTLFAYRITITDSIIPVNIVTNIDGWIFENNSIWTKDASKEFIFNSSNGRLNHIISIIEVKTLKNGIESDITQKDIRDRIVGTNLSCATGDINDQITGTGLRFYFTEKISDIFIEGFYAEQFMYRINTINEETDEIISEGTWYSTINSSNIREIILNSTTEPCLVENDEGEQTQIEAYIITNDSFEDSENTTTLNFKVQAGFSPSTIIYCEPYCNQIYVLGENHSSEYNIINHGVPAIWNGEEYRHAMPFWIDSNNDLACINSSDLEIFMSWGFDGEYYYNNPISRKRNIVLDEETGANYFSEILFYDVRLDDSPYENNELPPSVCNIIDNDGTEWLRIPSDEEISQKLVLSNLASGNHELSVRAVDLQLSVDPTHASYNFKVVEPVALENREGILILDDTQDNGIWAPADHMHSFYSTYGALSGYSGTIETLDRQNLTESELIMGSTFSLTELQNYKTVIYYSDALQTNFYKEQHALYQYLENGGNIILSMDASLYNAYNSWSFNNSGIFEKYFGIQSSFENTISNVSTSYYQNRFFIQAVAQIENCIDLNLLEPSFNSLVNGFNGDEVCALGPVSYINEESLSGSASVLFKFGCRPPGNEEYEPTQEDYDFYSDQVVSIKNITETNKCYLFSFPLSYMNLEQVNEILIPIIEEIEN